MNDLKDFDFIIGIGARDGSLVGSQACIYIKDGSDLQQIGLIQDLELKLSAKDILPDITITFPKEISEMSDQVKESLKNYFSLLKKKGCKIKII